MGKITLFTSSIALLDKKCWKNAFWPTWNHIMNKQRFQ